MAITIEKVEAAVREKWNPDFRYERNESAPITTLHKPVSQAKGALVSTGGVFLKGHPPFNDNYGIGDPSFREIPSDASAGDLTHYHEHYDPTHANRDINVVFPIERMRELKEEGIIGSLADTFYSFMGYLTVPHPLKRITAPQAAGKMQREQVDFALLVPV